VRVKVEGPKVLRDALKGALEDPRVGYTVADKLTSASVRLESVSGGPPYVDGTGPLAGHVLAMVREIVGGRILSGDEPNVAVGVGPDVAVGVPAGLEEPVIRGVLRGLMRHGRHGLKRRWF
jgi:hypothetical protein